MKKLDSAQRLLLEDLLEKSSENGGVDRLAYRAAHHKQIKEIDYLEMAGFVRKENEHYSLSLTALVQLDNPLSRRILEIAELLFERLKAHYLKSQREPLPVKSLAELAGVTFLDACEVLSYMIEGPWWGGCSTSFFATPDPYIQPAEQILGFNRFEDVIQQLLGWQDKRIQDRSQSLAAALLAYSPEGVMPEPPPPKGRTKPDWINQLPESSKRLLDETYSAWHHGLNALTAMGVRAVIDDVCLDLVGDIGGFRQKIRTLREKGHISSLEEEILSAAIDAGNASAHRGHVPNESDLKTLFDIVEHILRAQYVLPKAAGLLKANTPPRKVKTPIASQCIPPRAQSSQHKGNDSQHKADSGVNVERVRKLAAPIRGKQRAKPEDVRLTILALCSTRYMSLRQLAELLARQPASIQNHYLTPMLKEGVLVQRYPNNPNHPNQEYRKATE